MKGEHKNDNQKKNKNRIITTTVNIQWWFKNRKESNITEYYKKKIWSTILKCNITRYNGLIVIFLLIATTMIKITRSRWRLCLFKFSKTIRKKLMFLRKKYVWFL